MRDRPKVGEILVAAGIIDELQLASALGEQTRWGRRLGLTLVKLGMVQEGQLVRALAKQFDLPVASLSGKKIAPEVIALVPAKTAIEHSVIPLFVKKEGRKESLFLGMEEPSDLLVLDELAFRTGMQIRPVMVGPSELGEALDRYYSSKPATPSASGLPDPLRGADTVSESNLRRLTEEPAPTLSELLRPGPAAVDLGSESAPIPAQGAIGDDESSDATPMVFASPAPPRASAAPNRLSAAPIASPTASPAAHSMPQATPQPLAKIDLVSAAPAPAPAIAPSSPVPPLPTPAPLSAMPPLPTSAVPVAAPAASDALAREVARAIDETERTRLVAKAIAHLLIEKGVLTLDELQSRIEKMKAMRPEPPA